MTGPPGPPIAIGTVGRISRSQDHTESSPIRPASAATCAMTSGEAPRPATGRCTPSLTDVISPSLRRLLLGRPPPPPILIGRAGAGSPASPARRALGLRLCSERGAASSDLGPLAWEPV